MKRREFLGVLAGGAIAPPLFGPLAARAQQAVPVIGFLHSARPTQHLVAAFRQALAEHGYTEDQNVAIEFRSAEGRYDRLAELAAELVQRRVALIVAMGGENAALAAKAVTATIPIVFNVDREPAKLGLVQSLNRPGGNVTGVNQLVTELGAKGLGLLHTMIPPGADIALLVNPDFDGSEESISHTEVAARTAGRGLRVIRTSSERDFETLFRGLSRERAGGLIVAPDPLFFTQRERLVALAAQHAIPASYVRREFALAGGLMSYGTNLGDAYRQVGVYSARILKGEKPADLPVTQSTKFELVINLKTAKALGLAVPPTLLATADEAIE
jgi:putative ABC transport system substrate-binding protein